MVCFRTCNTMPWKLINELKYLKVGIFYIWEFLLCCCRDKQKPITKGLETQVKK